MLVEALWAVLITALLSFCGVKIYNHGYRKGAKQVIAEWKTWMDKTEEDD